MATKLNIDAIIDKSIPSSKLEDAIFQGTYNDMTVGNAEFANNAEFAHDLTGRNEATPQEFNFQPSAGDMSIKDETAVIKNIKGNSVVWNQQCLSYNEWITASASVSKNDNLYTITFSNSWAIVTLTESYPINDHKYYVKWSIQEHNIEDSMNLTLNGVHQNMVISAFFPKNNSEQIITFSNTTSLLTTTWGLQIGAITRGETRSVTFKGLPIIVDLTQMFGAGNEPSTVEEFYARIPSGIDVNAYNEGEIISMNTEAIKTVGFNAWDEQWELGTLTDVGAVAHNSAIISRNFNKILPSTAYYCAYLSDVGSIGNILQIGFWDMNMVYIDRFYVTNKVITTPANAAYFKVATNTSANITTYNHDICINLSHTGYKNGTYEPYKEYIRELPVIKKYFPAGMKKAGSVYDEIYFDESKQKLVAVQRVGEVDLGDLTWASAGIGDLYQAVILDKRLAASIGAQSNLLCDRYATVKITYASAENKPAYSVMESLSENKRLIYITDVSYTDAATFKAAMQGVKLYYELAEPIITEIDDVVDFDYYVEDFGTEEAISSVPSAPFKADIVYQFNAVDRIRQNDVKIESLDKKLDTKISEIIYGGTW